MSILEFLNHLPAHYPTLWLIIQLVAIGGGFVGGWKLYMWWANR